MFLKVLELTPFMEGGAFYGTFIELHHPLDEFLLPAPQEIFLEKDDPHEDADDPGEDGASHPGGPAFLPDDPHVERGKDGQQEDDEHYLEYLLYHVKSPGR